jgi:NADPH2:quinone reductase
MSGGPVFAQGLNCLAPFGRVIVYGTSSGAPLTFDDAAIRRFFYNPSLNQSVHSFNLGLWFGMRPEATGKAIGDMLEAVATGSVKLEVTEQLPLSQAAHAHRLIETRATTGKIVLMPWAE